MQSLAWRSLFLALSLTSFSSVAVSEPNVEKVLAPDGGHVSVPDNASVLPLGRESSTQVGRSIDDYLSKIGHLESRDGPYASRLSQEYVGLGGVYQSRGENDVAIDYFKRAIHVNRINEGLYNLNQVPMLERLIGSYIAQGQWEDANKRHHYLYWVYQRNLNPQDPRMLPVMEKLSSWHLNAYTQDIGNTLFNHLIKAFNLYKAAGDIIDANYGENDPRLIDVLHGLTTTSYYLATYQGKPNKGFKMKTDADTTSTKSRALLDQYIINSYSSGKKAITRLMNVYANNSESPPAAEAKAKIELGDWYLLFNKRNSALQAYQEAYSALWTDKTTRGEVAMLFGRPVALPTLPFIIPPTVEKRESASYVLASFDVTSYGRAKNIKILESHPPDSVRIRSRTRKALKVAKFRPRFANGMPILTEGVTRRYWFAKD